MPQLQQHGAHPPTQASTGPDSQLLPQPYRPPKRRGSVSTLMTDHMPHTGRSIAHHSIPTSQRGKLSLRGAKAHIQDHTDDERLRTIGVSSFPGATSHPPCCSLHTTHLIPQPCLEGSLLTSFTSKETEPQGVHGPDPGSHSPQVEEAHGIQTQGSLSQTHSESGSLLPSLFGACREPRAQLRGGGCRTGAGQGLWGGQDRQPAPRSPEIPPEF